MRKLFKERKLFKGGNYMRKNGIQNSILKLSFDTMTHDPDNRAKKQTEIITFSLLLNSAITFAKGILAPHGVSDGLSSMSLMYPEKTLT